MKETRWLVLVMHTLCSLKEITQVVNGHTVTSLLRFAEVTCEHTFSPPRKHNGTKLYSDEQTKCKYQFLGIITKQGDLVDVEMMAFTLGYIFGESSYHTGAKLAKQIHEKCGEKLISVQKKPVKEWTPFFTCVEGIIKIEKRISGRSSYHDEQETDRLKNLTLSQAEIDQIRPKLHCHPSYDTDASNWERGEGLRIFSYKFCVYGKGQDVNCAPLCMCEQLGILEPSVSDFSKYFWNDLDSFISQFRNFLKDSDYLAAKGVAERVFEACRNKVLQKPYERYICHTETWVEFLNCVNLVIDCESENVRKKS